MLTKIKKEDYSQSEQSPETVYNLAKKEWDGIVGSAMTQKREWQRFAYLLLLIVAIAVVGIIYLANRSTIIPYVVEINTDNGKTIVTKLDYRKEYTPSEAIIKSKVASFVQLIQTVSTDQIVIQDNLLKAYDMVTPQGYALLTTYIRDKRKPFELAGKKAITLENLVVNKITEGSFQVEWAEEEYKVGSQEKPVIMHYTGTFTIRINPPTTEAKLLKNPLGIDIEEFHISIKFQVK